MAADTNNEKTRAREVWARYDDKMDRGHEEYCRHALFLERMYMGGGRQWRDEDRAAVEGSGRPASEVNLCLAAVNTAAGFQIANRVDIAYHPRGRGADELIAKTLTKVNKTILDNNDYRFKETDVFLDGLIQQRGYFDLRMSYDANPAGEPVLDVLDPLDVLPDTDARHYDPDRWADVDVTRYMTRTEIEQTYGKEAADVVAAYVKVLSLDEGNFGEERGVRRDAFGTTLPMGYQQTRAWIGEGVWTRYRIIDRQSHEYVMALAGRWPTGDIRSLEGMPREHIAALIDQGVYVAKMRMRRVRWSVVAPDVVLHDAMSPYDHFTVIPYFPYFRRGKTVGMIDNAVSPQEVINKFISQMQHYVNATANGGWQGEADSLANMSDDEFTERGAETGLVLLRKPNKPPLEKISPNPLPQGIAEIINLARDNFKQVTGVNDNLFASNNASNMSGEAIKSLQFAAQQQLGISLDNLNRTRKMLGRNMLSLIQKFMTDEREFRITELDPFGAERRVPMTVNQIQPDGSVIRDMTIGTYDVTVTEQPMAVTFDNTQFEQIKAMRNELGVQIPDSVVIRYSSIPDKAEIAQAMSDQTSKPDPVAEAQAELVRAQTRKADAESVTKQIEAQFSAIRTAEVITMNPHTAQIADALLRSGGYVDRDAAPIIPQGLAPVAGALPPPENTNPLTPDNPDRGMTTGMSATPPLQ